MEDIFDQIVSKENLYNAWEEFRRGKRKRTDVQTFEHHQEDHLFDLRQDLTDGTYQHGLYHQFHVFDPKHRIIHKAIVRDRLVHHAVYRVMYPKFERSFIFDSYSCRIGKGTHAGVKRLETFARRVSQNFSKPCWGLKLDIKKFFDSVDHEILLNILSRKIECIRTMALLTNIVQSFSKSPELRGGGALFESNRTAGLPIGNLTSQLFANVYMDAFDHFIKDELELKHYIRYTDDEIILRNNPDNLLALITIIKQWLWKYRRLTIHPNKIEIRKFSQGFDFLGYVVLPWHIRLRTKTKRRMLNRLNEKNNSSYFGLLSHCNGFELEQQMRKLYLHRQNKG